MYNNSSLSKLGLGVMACTGTISGQLFNLLMGFGLNLLRQTLPGKDGKYRTVKFNIFSPGKENRFTAVFAVAILTSSILVLSGIMIISIKHKYQFTKRMGGLLVLCYLLLVPLCFFVYIFT